MNDLYNTIEASSTGIYKEKGSKFLSFAYPVFNEEEIKKHLSILREKYFDARHHCYAYLLKADKSVYRTNDDGEPSNTGGKPILGQINSKDLTNVVVIVVRYFGGTLLGVSGLINAYRTAAQDALNNSKIIECTVNDIYHLTFQYSSMKDIMKILKDDQIDQTDQKFDLECSLNFSVRKSQTEKIIQKLKMIKTVNIKYLYTV